MSRFARRVGLLLVTLVLLAPAAVQAGTVRGVPTEDEAIEALTVAGVNEVRRDHGLRALRVSSGLAAAALVHARQMADGGFFAHESLDGAEFWERIGRFYPGLGSERWSVGENLLWASPSVSAERAVELWLASPSHRRVLLNPAWSEIGLAAVHLTNAPGIFLGLEITILTADFGTRA